MLPCVVAEPCVDRLALVEVVVEDLTTACAPRLVGDDALHVTIGEDDLELRVARALLAVHRALTREAEPAAVPAVAEAKRDHRVLFDRHRDVMLDEANAPLVA